MIVAARITGASEMGFELTFVFPPGAPPLDVERFEDNPVVLRHHETTETPIAMVEAMELTDTGITMRAEWAAVNASPNADAVRRKVLADPPLMRWAEAAIDDSGELIEVSLVTLFSPGAVVPGLGPAPSDSGQRAICSKAAPCGQSGCATCEAVPHHDEEDPDCDCSDRTCAACVAHFDSNPNEERAHMATRQENIDTIKKHDPSFAAAGKSDAYIEAAAERLSRHSDASDDDQAQRDMTARNIAASRKPFGVRAAGSRVMVAQTGGAGGIAVADGARLDADDEAAVRERNNRGFFASPGEARAYRERMRGGQGGGEAA